MPELIQIDEQGNIIVRINWKRILKAIVILLLSWGGYYLPIPGLTDASRICLMIYIGAAGFWVTEAIPPFETANLEVVLNIYLLGHPVFRQYRWHRYYHRNAPPMLLPFPPVQ